MLVSFLPTGRAEAKALPRMARRLFPDHAFDVILRRAEDGAPFDGFTSTPLTHPPTTSALTYLDAVIQAAAARLTRKSRRDPPAADFVFILEDLELANAHQPGAVLDAVRAAVGKHLSALRAHSGDAAADAAAATLRDRVSFHLAVPMIEAWIFADPHGLARAGVPPDRLPPRLRGPDPESFTCDDPAFLADDAACCDAWRALPSPRQRRHRPPWLIDPALRAHHPKAYLAWLLRDPAEDDCTRYQETHSGAAALEALDWAAALRHPPACAWMRALLQDLSSALDHPLPAIPSLSAPADPATLPPTALASPRAQPPILRNL